MQKLLALALAGAVCAAAAAPADAQTRVTDRGQIGNATTLDWNAEFPGDNFPLPNPIIVDHNGLDVTLSSDGDHWKYVAGSSWSGGFLDGDGLVFTQTGTMMDFVFSSLVQGFATQIWHNFPPGDNVTLTAYRGGMNIFSFTDFTGGGFDLNNNQATLFGLMDGTGFDRVTLETANGEFAINYVTLGDAQQVVPEPISMALLGTGLAGLGAVRRRRRQID